MLYKIWLLSVGLGSLGAASAVLWLGMFMRNPYTFVWQQNAYENSCVRNFGRSVVCAVLFWLLAWVIWP